MLFSILPFLLSIVLGQGLNAREASGIAQAGINPNLQPLFQAEARGNHQWGCCQNPTHRPRNAPQVKSTTVGLLANDLNLSFISAFGMTFDYNYSQALGTLARGRERYRVRHIATHAPEDSIMTYTFEVTERLSGFAGEDGTIPFQAAPVPLNQVKFIAVYQVRFTNGLAYVCVPSGGPQFCSRHGNNIQATVRYYDKRQ